MLPARLALACVIVLPAVLHDTGLGQCHYQLQKLEASDGSPWDTFGYSSALHDDLLAIGTLDAEFHYSGRNAVYVFRRGSSGWVLEQEIVPAQSNRFFGTSLALGSDVLLVSAAGESGGGSAHVFRHNGGAWVEE